MIDFRPSKTRRTAFVLFVLAVIPTLWFALRTYSSLQLLRSAYEAGAPETSAIRGWMTLKFVANTYHIPALALTGRLGLPAETDLNASLKSIAEHTGLSPYQYVLRVQRAVADVGAKGSPDRTTKSSGWLAAVGDQALSALLVYGYSALGLILLLGSLGLPVPDGLATTVAGSLAAQGHMNWIVAGSIAVAASVLGDIVGYGLGRVLDREVLERRSSWLGFTVLRRIRVEALFERWGALTVFITRTFVSYLSMVASLLAGMSRYPLGRYLPIGAAGRVVWTAAYLGLGYVIGADLEAATGFLGNLTGFLLCAMALVLSASIAMVRSEPT